MKSLRDAFREDWQRRNQKPTEPQYLYKTFQGVDGHPKLERLLSEGWEVIGSDPVMLAGVTINQRKWRLRRPNPRFGRPVDTIVDLAPSS